MSSFSFIYNGALNQSYEGQLASQYTNWVAAQVQGAADWIAYTWYQNSSQSPEDLQKAIEIRDALENGSFSLSDLFLAAQSKSSAVVDPNGIPDPHVTVAGITFSLDDFFGNQTAISQWSSGPSKNVQYHNREYLTDFQSGTAPDGWDQPQQNEAPTSAPVYAEAVETLSTYDSNHQITNQDLPGDSDQQIVDLLQNAVDPDGDPMSVSNFQFYDKDGNPIAQPSYISIDGNNLVIEQNDPALNSLLNGSHLLLSATYEISDDHGHTVTNTVYIDIAGTADQYNQSGTGSDTNVHDKADGNQNNQTLYVDQSVFPDDAFDFSFSGTITVSSAGLASGPPQEQSTVSDFNADDWANPAITISDSTSPQSQTLDVAGALDDFEVDYNISFNGPADNGDKVTVTLNYSYDYWYSA